MDSGGSDEFSGRLGLIFATIGAAIGTGNIWRFPRMVGANGGGSFLVPWLIFLFLWSIPLIIAEFALGKRSRTGTVGTFRIFAGRRFAWMELLPPCISASTRKRVTLANGGGRSRSRERRPPSEIRRCSQSPQPLR